MISSTKHSVIYLPSNIVFTWNWKKTLSNVIWKGDEKKEKESQKIVYMTWVLYI